MIFTPYLMYIKLGIVALLIVVSNYFMHSYMVGKLDTYKLQMEREKSAAVALYDNEKDLRRKDEMLAQSKSNQIRRDRDVQIAAVNSKLNDALNGLSNRPERISDAKCVSSDTGDCKGNTGRELSRPDAEFLSREAARADKLREDLAACYRDYSNAQELVSKPPH
jgi:hypothetical protein